MKRYTIKALSMMIAMVTLSSFAHADSPTREQEALMQSERDWASAWASKDAEAVAALEADEYIFTNFDGVVTDKASDLADVRSGNVTSSWTVDDMRAMVYGDTGVVAGHQTQQGTLDGRDVSGAFRFTDTWIKRDGRWQCVASQVSRVEAPAPTP